MNYDKQFKLRIEVESEIVINTANPMRTKTHEEVEDLIADIFRSTLKVENIDRNSGFFEMGGSSLKLMEVLTRIKEEFGDSIEAPDLLEYPTIRSLANVVFERLTPEKKK